MITTPMHVRRRKNDTEWRIHLIDKLSTFLGIWNMSFMRISVFYANIMTRKDSIYCNALSRYPTKYSFSDKDFFVHSFWCSFDDLTNAFVIFIYFSLISLGLCDNKIEDKPEQIWQWSASDLVEQFFFVISRDSPHKCQIFFYYFPRSAEDFKYFPFLYLFIFLSCLFL